MFDGIKTVTPLKAKLKSWIDGSPVTVWYNISIVLKVTLVDWLFASLSMFVIRGFTHVLLPIGEDKVMPPPFWMFWVRLLFFLSS